MTPYNRRHPRREGYSPSSLTLAQDLYSHHTNTVLALLTLILDLNTELIGSDLSDTAERLNRYLPKQLTKDSLERISASQDQEAKNVLSHYLNQSTI